MAVSSDNFEELWESEEKANKNPVFYKKEKSSKIYWLDTSEQDGAHVFSFDKETTFNLFSDYPWKLTKKQEETFDKENPFWANYFKDRK